MKKNIGGCDAGLRLVIGLGLLSLIVVLDGDVRWVGLLGIIPLVTAVARVCPLYTLIGVKTSACCGGKSCGCSDKKDAA